jgi:hypothetical protein
MEVECLLPSCYQTATGLCRKPDEFCAKRPNFPVYITLLSILVFEVSDYQGGQCKVNSIQQYCAM